MSVIIYILLFLLGMVLCIQTIVAWYGFIDLGYRIRSAWPGVVIKAAAWSAAAVLPALLVGRFRSAYLWGLAFFVLCHFGVFAFNRLVLGRPKHHFDA